MTTDPLYTYDAVVTAVYDGDTVTATIDLGFHLCAKGVKLRLHGVDTEELRGGSATTKEAGRRARDYVRGRILDQTVRVHTLGRCKYGRYLAVVWTLDGDGNPHAESLNDQLVRLGMAKPYPVTG